MVDELLQCHEVSKSKLYRYIIHKIFGAFFLMRLYVTPATIEIELSTKYLVQVAIN